MNLRALILKNKNILFLFLLALVIRLAYACYSPQFPLMKDASQYDIIAKNILAGNGFSYDSFHPTAARGPLYPFFLATAYFLFGHNYTVARVLQGVIGAVTCLIIYSIAKRLYNPKIGFYALMLAGIYPSLIGYVGLLYAETLAAFLLALTILFYLLSAEKKSLFFVTITGALFGLLILCYPKFLFLPFLYGASIYFFNKFQKEFVRYFIALIVGTFLILAPWTLRNLNAFGKFIPGATGLGTTLWHSTLPEDDTEWRFDKDPLLSEFRTFFHDHENIDEQHEFLFSVRTNDRLMHKALNNIRNNPPLFLRLCTKRLFRQWFASNGNSFYALRSKAVDSLVNRDYGSFSIKLFLLILQLCVIIFGLMGIFSSIKSDRKNIFSPLFISICYSVAINSIFMTQPRYQIPVLGLLFIYTASGVHWAFSKVSNSKD